MPHILIIILGAWRPVGSVIIMYFKFKNFVDILMVNKKITILFSYDKYMVIKYF